MKGSPTKTICFFHSPQGWSDTEERILAKCKEEMRNGNNVILVANVHSQLAVKAIHDRVNVYQFRLGKLSHLNPLKLAILTLFFKMKKIEKIHFSEADKNLEKFFKTIT